MIDLPGVIAGLAVSVFLIGISAWSIGYRQGRRAGEKIALDFLESYQRQHWAERPERDTAPEKTGDVP